MGQATKKPVERQLVDIQEAQKILSICRAKVYALMSAGELAWVKLGKSRRIRLDSLNALIDRNTHAAR